MGSSPSLGIERIEGLHYYVRDLERTRRFLIDKLDFAELGTSGPELEHDGKQRSAAFKAGDALLVIHQPIGEGGRAWRYLRKHPEGVGTVVFDVADIDRAFALLDARGGTFITDVLRFSDDGGTLAMFSITTPFGDTTFRFVERRGYSRLFPGFVPAPGGGRAGNRFGFQRIDHLTSNFQTMKPALLWMQHVLGFEQLWEIAFHTNDVAVNMGTLTGSPNRPATSPAAQSPSGAHAAEKRTHGSGLKSVVMWDPASGVKFANNEPFRPFFKQSQINLFSEDNRGDGVQHSALSVGDIMTAVRGLRGAGVEFMPTPGSYYDALPERLKRIGVGSVDESLATLRELEILVDGERPHQYLLQIFLKEAAGLHHDPEAGPFFFEIIQRKGDEGFGAGNFRALFEAIEREQTRTQAGARAMPRM